MTVSSDVSRNDYDGNGVTVDFPISFRFLVDTDLRVIRTVVETGVQTELILNSTGADGFTADGAGDPSGGELHVVTAPTSSQRITILCEPPTTQLTDYIANDPFSSDSHERALDKLTMIARSHKEKLARTLTLQESSVGVVSAQLPAPTPNYVFGWASDGGSIVNVDLSGVADLGLRPDLSNPSIGEGASLVGFTATGTGTIARTVQGKLSDIVSVKDFGAKGDGVTDDRSAFQLAIDSRLNVYVPVGDYIINGSLSLRSFQNIYGPAAWSVSSTTQGPQACARLIFTGTATACITQSDPGNNFLHAGIHNITVRATGTYTWMLDFTSVIGFKMTNCHLETTQTTTGGLHTAKIDGAGFSWANHFQNVHIRLPNDATARVIDTDTSDTPWIGGTLGGGQGIILRGTGGWKIIGTIINNATYGVTISSETESQSQHQLIGCQIEENTVGGLLLDGDANDSLVSTSVQFVVSGCQFRNPDAGQDIVFQNATGPVVLGGAIVGCMFTAPSTTRIVRDPLRWRNVTISGCTENAPSNTADNYVANSFLSMPLVLSKGGVAASHTGNTTETVLATIAVPAGCMGPNGRLRVTTLWSMTNNANNKNLRVKFSGTNFTSVPVTTQASAKYVTEVTNRNDVSSQVGAPANFIGIGQSTAAVVTSAINTSVAQNIEIATQLANAADTVTLEGYLVELIRGE